MQLIATVNNMTDMRTLFTNKWVFFKEGEVEEREEKGEEKETEADLRRKLSRKKRQAS